MDQGRAGEDLPSCPTVPDVLGDLRRCAQGAPQRDRRSQEGHRRAVSHIFPTWASRYAQTVPRGPRMSVLLSQPAVTQQRVALETNSNGAAPSPMVVCQGSGSVVIPPSTVRPVR